MSIIYSIKDGKPAVDVDDTKPFNQEETSASFEKVFVALNAVMISALNDELVSLSEKAAEDVGLDVKFIPATYSSSIVESAAPPNAFYDYFADENAPQLSEDELMKKFGWNNSSTVTVPIGYDYATPIFS